jgi:predicted Zn-dependent protease
MNDAVRSIPAFLAFGILLTILACSSGDDSCEGTRKRVCLVPFGNVSGDLVEQLVDHYQSEYDLEVQALDKESIPQDAVDAERDQVGAVALIEHMENLFPEEYADPDAIVIGLTPVDMYTEVEDWRFAFWTSNIGINKSAVSSFRMDPETFGLDTDDDLLFTRVRKVITHIIGSLYFDLPDSSDPQSVMYNNVLSLDDLDRIGEKLPIEASR